MALPASSNGAIALIGVLRLGIAIEITTFVDNSGWKQNDVLTVSLQGNK